MIGKWTDGHDSPGVQTSHAVGPQRVAVSWTDLDMRSIDTGKPGAHALTLGRMFSNSNSYEPSRQSNEGAHEPHHQLGFVYMCGSQRARIATQGLEF